jgi:hypothetical protein
MRYWISLSLLLLATAAVSMAQTPVASASPTPQATQTTQASASASPSASAADDDSALSFPVPPHSPVKDIRIPQYGPDGKLTTFFFAKQAEKTDDDHIEMVDLSINAYNTDGTKFDIELPKSLLNLKTRVLKGDDHVFINRDDFQIEGDAVEFHIKSRFGKITGNVKMTIYNTDKINQ